MRLKAKRVPNGFLIPLIEELKDRDEIEVEIKVEQTDFLNFLYEIYNGQENISNTSDEEALEIALKDKYGVIAKCSQCGSEYKLNFDILNPTKGGIVQK